MIRETKIHIDGIPALQITCGDMPKGVVLFYHGWTSRKEYQALRGRILAAYGYDVLIPDAVNHGSRGAIDYEQPSAYGDFWQTIFQNLREVPLILEYIRQWRRHLPCAVMGHSMGAFTALGVMTHYDAFCTAVAMNGSGWWDESDRRFRAALHMNDFRGSTMLAMQLRAMDPYAYTDRLAGRSVLALNGRDDGVVDHSAQVLYMDKIRADSRIRSRLTMYDGLGHFVTTNMMDEAVQWLDAETAGYFGRTC